VPTIVFGELQAGICIRQTYASAFASGDYFYRLEVSNFEQKRELVVVKEQISRVDGHCSMSHSDFIP